MSLPFLQGCFLFGGPKLQWRAPIASAEVPMVQNGTVYVPGIHAGHPEESRRLFALDATDGKERWVSKDSIKELYGESGGSVFFRNLAGHLVQLDARTGEKTYESDDDRPFYTWLLQGDRMFIVNDSMQVVAVDNRLNQVLWRRQLPEASMLAIQASGANIIVSGHLGNGTTRDQYGMIWALDASTGEERWNFEPPPPLEFAPLKVLVYDAYILATNTSPLALRTHVLDAQTGKELYPPIGAFDFYGCYEHTAYAPGGTFDLRTGRRMSEKAEWVSHSAIHNGIAWQCHLGMVGPVKAFLLRTTYDGDMQGKRDWLSTPPNSSLEGFDLASGKSAHRTKEYRFTAFSQPVVANGILYHSSIALMKEGESGVWAYRLP